MSRIRIYEGTPDNKHDSMFLCTILCFIIKWHEQRKFAYLSFFLLYTIMVHLKWTVFIRQVWLVTLCSQTLPYSRILYRYLNALYINQKSRPSPMSQISKTPFSGNPLFSNARFNNCGGSNTSSSATAHVPQCIAIALLHRVSLKIATESNGFECTGLSTCRGLYAPIGISPRSNGPRKSPICLKAGQTGKSANSGKVQSSSMFLVELGTERYPVSPAK